MTSALGKDWRDVLSVAGFVIGVVGLMLTVAASWGARKAAKQAKTAAEQARAATTQVKERLFYVDSVRDLSEAVTIMEEIQRLHRVSAWHVLLDRYVAVRKLLITIRSADHINDEHKDALAAAIVQFSGIGKEIERAVHDNQKIPPNVAKLNDIVAMQMDKLNEIRADVRRAGGDT